MDQRIKNTPASSLKSRLRVIWAIAIKDIREAIKNKNTLTVILSALFVVGIYRLMPVLTSDDIPAVLVYDAGGSQISEALEDSQMVDLYTYQTYERFENALMSGESAELGLVIPEGYDEQLSQGNAEPLQTYLMYFVKPGQAQELIEVSEAEIQRLSGQGVSLARDFLSITPTPERNSLGLWGAMSIIFAILMVGISLIPHLFMEEKQRKTLDVLLISPAGAGDIVIAKALAGAFYGVLIALVIVAFYGNLLIHPQFVFLAIGLMIGFTVALGLLLGILVENRGQLGLITWMLVVPLFLTVVLVLLEDLIPELVIQIAQFIPTLAVLSISQAAFGDPYDASQILLWTGYVLLWIGGLLAVCTRLVKRLGRAGQMRQASSRNGSLLSRRPHRDEEASEAPTPAPIKLEALSLGANAAAAAPARPAGWVIVASIAGKDIGEALHNKLALSILLGTLLMVVLNSAMPRLISGRSTPGAIVVDTGEAQWVQNLPVQDDYRLRVVDSEQAMMTLVGMGNTRQIGLVLPDDFTRRMEAGAPVELQAYAIHWMRAQDAERLGQYFSQVLSQASGTQVEIRGAPPLAVYPDGDNPGQIFLLTQLLAYVLLMVGVILVPLLLLEEKENHTLEILRVSPASNGHILLGKALAGGFYGVLAGGVMLALNGYMVANWGIALLALFGTILFSVSLGLLIGVLADNATSASAWGGLIMLVLVLLTLFVNYLPAGWPAWLKSGLTYQPAGALVNLFQSACLGDPLMRSVYLSLGTIFLASLLLLLLVRWRLGLLDRKA